MDEEADKNTFILNSLVDQVLKPLDVKTKFYNAEVSLFFSFFEVCTTPSQRACQDLV